jgi:hypothetical protein
MNGNIAQIFALVLFGNQYLSGTPVTDFWPGASVFQFNATVHFVTLSGSGASHVETVVAGDPLTWFEQLKAQGIVGLRLHHVPQNKTPKEDRVLAGLANGGGRWLIEAVRDAYTADFWQGRWDIGDRNATDRKIWKVTYGLIGERDKRPPEADPPLATLKSDVEEILTDIAAFADQHGKAEFAARFRHGKEMLSDAHPMTEGYGADLSRSSRLSLPAAQLFGAAAAAWVFGAMGSWNDMSFAGDEQKNYGLLSDALFVRLIRAVVGSANSTFSDGMMQQPGDPASPTPASSVPGKQGWLSRFLGRAEDSR